MGTTTDVSDQHALSWIDVFPFLSSTRGAPSWCHEAVGEIADGEREWCIDAVARAASAQVNARIGDLFPDLPNVFVHDLGLPNRARNVLSRRGYTTSADLLELPIHEMIDWPGVGSQTVDAVLRGLAGLLIDRLVNAEFETSDSGVIVARTITAAPWLADLANDLREVARWKMSLGRPGDSPIGSLADPTLPTRMRAIAHRLLNLTAAGLLADQPQTTLADLIEEALSDLDDRGREVLRQRAFAHTSPTLDQLGDEFGVTRERIRQIEAKSRKLLVERIAEPGALADAASTVAGTVGLLRPFADLLHELPALTDVVTSLNEPAWRVLDVLDDAYEIKDGWCASPSVASAQEATELLLAELANDHGVVPVDAVDAVVTRRMDARAATYQWLAYCGYSLHDDWVLTRTGSIPEYCAGLLSALGAPQSTEALQGMFDRDRSVNSIRNALSGDKRFVRADRDTWALEEWGLAGYTSIRDKIREHLEANGGSAPLAALVEAIAGKFTVATTSVIAYAGSVPFSTVDGVVSLAEAPARGKSPKRTRHIYRRDDAWLYRTVITKDHLRGSGSPAPSAITEILNMSFGDERTLSSADGEQSVYWTGLQPGFGTIRRLIQAQDLSPGTAVFFVLGDDGSFAIEPVLSDGLDGVPRAASLVGSPSPNEPLAALATAIGLDPAADLEQIRSAYEARGETEIIDCLSNP